MTVTNWIDSLAALFAFAAVFGLLTEHGNVEWPSVKERRAHAGGVAVLLLALSAIVTLVHVL
jgi:hypothetical protein